MAFRLLPPEVVLEILSHTSFASLAAFRATSQHSNTLVSDSAERLFRHLSFRHGYCKEASSSATGLTLQTLRPSVAFDPAELARVVAAQRAMGGTYAGCQSWEDFARRRTCLDRNWRAGVCVQQWRDLSEVQDQGVWRWKLDPEACGGLGAIVTSGVGGGYQAYNAADGQISWDSVNPDFRYPHVELSAGYLVMSDPDSDDFTIWRRSEITSPPALIDLVVAASLEGACVADPNGGLAYSPFCELRSPSGCNATKLRYPTFVAVSFSQQEFYLWDVPTATLTATISIAPLFDPTSPFYDRTVLYVELDDQVVIIAGSRSISIWNLLDGNLLGTLPPPPGPTYWPLASSEPDYFRADVNARSVPGWAAVHHGTDGNDFVAVSRKGTLLWTPRHRRDIGSQEALEAGTVVLQMRDPIKQLAVENGRAVFVTKTDYNQFGLWLLNLRDFASLDDFKANPPVPICLSFPLPTYTAPSRVEMTSDTIFIGAHSPFAPDGALATPFAALDETGTPALEEHKWCALDGTVLGYVNRMMEDERLKGELVREMPWERLVRKAEAGPGGALPVDSFLVFNFKRWCSL